MWRLVFGCGCVYFDLTTLTTPLNYCMLPYSSDFPYRPSYSLLDSLMGFRVHYLFSGSAQGGTRRRKVGRAHAMVHLD